MRSVADTVTLSAKGGRDLVRLNLQENVSATVLLGDLSAEKPWPVAQNIERDVLANGSRHSRAGEVLRPGLCRVSCGLRQSQRHTQGGTYGKRVRQSC